MSGRDPARVPLGATSARGTHALALARTRRAARTAALTRTAQCRRAVVTPAPGAPLIG